MCDQQRLRPACAYAQSDQSFWLSLEYSMTLRLLTEYDLEFLSLKVACTGSSESTHVKNATSLEITCHGSNEILFIKAGICKILVRLANREDQDQTASSDLSRYRLVWPF